MSPPVVIMGSAPQTSCLSAFFYLLGILPNSTCLQNIAAESDMETEAIFEYLRYEHLTVNYITNT